MNWVKIQFHKVKEKVLSLSDQQVEGELQRMFNKSCRNPLDFFDQTYKELLLIRFLNIENELSVSDVGDKHGALHDVRIRNASDLDADASQTSGELPLGSRTDVKEEKITCISCGKKLPIKEFPGPLRICYDCGE